LRERRFPAPTKHPWETLLTGHPLHERRRCDDRNIAEGIEREQIVVAGDEQIRMAVDGQLEKFVVRGIAARSNSCSSVASDLSRPPRRSTTSAAISGMDFCVSAALTRTLVSRTILIQPAARLSSAVDVVIGECIFDSSDKDAGVAAPIRSMTLVSEPPSFPLDRDPSRPPNSNGKQAMYAQFEFCRPLIPSRPSPHQASDCPLASLDDAVQPLGPAA
jgi:hypothetical protein